MRRFAFVVMLALAGVITGHSSVPASEWAINATAIEACSCPHFCICYFNAHPATHHDHGQPSTTVIQQCLQGQSWSLRRRQPGRR